MLAKLSKYTVIPLIALLAFTPARPQADGGTSSDRRTHVPVASSRIIPDSGAIGDHYMIEIDIEKDLMQVIGFPDFSGGMFTDHIEILEENYPDTIHRDGRRVTIRKTYKVTTFDEGTHILGRLPMLYMDKNITDTIWTRDSLTLQVGTFDIDLETMSIFDIKDQINTPFNVGELIPGIIYYPAIRWLLVAIAMVILFWRKRYRPAAQEERIKIAPHIAAITALESLHNQKIWQNNKHKLYYSRLTDILREYIDGRYDIPAMENTTDEILDGLKGVEMDGASLKNLETILRSADLVKFAKYIPAPEENETAYQKAFYFVENTKPTEVEEPTEPDETITVTQP